MSLETMQELLIHQLKDIYSAEQMLLKALPKMQEKASTEELATAFGAHLVETKNQVARLDQALKILGEQPGGVKCKAMEGLIAEAQEILDEDGNETVIDAGIIAAAQRVEHYEIAGYGCARTFARRVGRNDVANLLQETLDEEGNADKILTDIAETWVNAQAARA